MTYGDVIRNMNDEELATYLYFCKEPVITNSQYWCEEDCSICIKKIY